MMSKLDDLLARIDPNRTIYDSDSLLAQALNSYQYSRSVVTDWSQFQKILGDFYWHVESIMLGVQGKVDPDDGMNQGFARQVLDQIYGGHGSATAFSIAQSGAEGGLYGVLKKVGEASARKYTERHIDYEVDRYVSELMRDYSQYEAAVDDYVQKYASILPAEALANGAVDIKINFGKALKQHPYIVKRMRELGRI
jgi:hypothetical protein